METVAGGHRHCGHDGGHFGRGGFGGEIIEIINGPVFNGPFNPQAENSGTINGGGSGQTGQQIFGHFGQGGFGGEIIEIINGPVFNGAFNPQAENSGTINGGGSGQTGQQIFNF